MLCQISKTGSGKATFRIRAVFDTSTTLILEIQFGAGGLDSKLFVTDLLQMYLKYAANLGFKTEILTEENGHVILKVSGEKVWNAFEHEIGNHIVQRIPPTENNGRRQTSVVTVAVLPLPPEHTLKPLDEKDLDIKFQCASGPGGQHQNKRASAARISHIPTGLQVFITGRDQHANRREALRVLTARVNEHYQQQNQSLYDTTRKNQMAGGNSIGKRGEKTRTYNFCKSRVVDHKLGTKTKNVKEIMKGNLSLLLNQGAKI